MRQNTSIDIRCLTFSAGCARRFIRDLVNVANSLVER